MTSNQPSLFLTLSKPITSSIETVAGNNVPVVTQNLNVTYPVTNTAVPETTTVKKIFSIMSVLEFEVSAILPCGDI